MVLKKLAFVLFFFNASVATFAVHTTSTFQEKDSYSFIFVTLEQSVVQFQQYSLQDLAELSYVSGGQQVGHTFLELNMQESDLNIVSIGFDESDIGTIIITAQRGDSLINYYVYWSQLFLRDGARVADCLGVEFDVMHDAVFSQDGQADDTQTWPSVIYGQWMLDGQELLVMNFAFDRTIKSACALFVPSADYNMLAGRLTKKEALEQGVIRVISEAVDSDPLDDQEAVLSVQESSWLSSLVASVGSWFGMG